MAFITAAAIVGGAGVLGSLAGDFINSNAQQNISEAQLGQQQSTQQLALAYAQPTLSELEMQGAQLSNYNQMQTRSEQMLAAIDPSIISAGRQANAILNGGNSATTNAALAQRSLDRQQLQANLEKEYGTGYSTSAAGTQQLNQFDTATASVVAQSNQASLQGLTSDLSSYMSSTNQDIGTLGSLANSIVGEYQKQQGLQVSALEGSPITMAGANNVGQATMGNALGSLGNSVAQGAGQVIGRGIGTPSNMGPSGMTNYDQNELQGQIGSLGGTTVAPQAGNIGQMSAGFNAANPGAILEQ